MFVVLFEVYPRAEQMQQYLEIARLLRPELEQIQGFIYNERFINPQEKGHILSFSSWANEKALIRWRTHAQHHQAQEQGRTTIFQNYRLRIGEVIADSAYDDEQIVPQRHDTSETSQSKVIQVIEVEHADQAAAIMAQLAHAPAHQLIEQTQFSSITQAGKQVILCGWSNPIVAQQWYQASIMPLAHNGLRSRLVHVIRAYGLDDRYEAPQYYPAAPAIQAIW